MDHVGQPKFIFITGGVMSGIGKGVVTASLGKILQFRGFSVSPVKIDPYLNVDPGTLNPVEHGECFVTEEVWNFTPVPEYIYRIAEIDQDFSTYEKFLGMDVHPSHNITSGQIYLTTILGERRGMFEGKTVQLIPHATDIIKRRLINIATKSSYDIVLVECGGTVGDLESSIFLEAFRQLKLELGHHSVVLVHVTLVPYSRAVGQMKSKPTQHSVKTLQAAGLQPDILVCRSEVELDESTRSKISMFSNVGKGLVISNPDLSTVYELPLVFERQSLGDSLCELLDLKAKLIVTETAFTNYTSWSQMVEKFKTSTKTLKIAMPGKYFNMLDSYISINDALQHTAAFLGCSVELSMINLDGDTNVKEVLQDSDGILLTPGFGERSTSLMISCAEYAMDENIPFLGICFGAQLLFIAYCRKYLGLTGASSTEFDPGTKYPVVDLLESQRNVVDIGGTMRLGAHEVVLSEGTILGKAYGVKKVKERFRHRYHIQEKFLLDVSKQAVEKIEGEKGVRLVVSSRDSTGEIVNSIEVLIGDKGEKSSWIVGTQFHPEFKSRPYAPSPVYLSFLSKCLENRICQQARV